MHSKIYVGQVSHKRYVPREHSFKYSMFMMYLDLDELPWLFDKYLFWSSKHFNLAWFNRKHHIGRQDESLKTCVIDKVYKETGTKINGPVRLLTHMSYFGYGFNPVSFYYCFDKDGVTIKAILVEVNNTPWGEQYSYVLPACKSENDTIFTYLLNKQFHVSPFQPMDMGYEWKLSYPGVNLSVHMKNYKDRDKVFDAVLALKQQDINSISLASVLTRFPLMTFKVIAAIYYEAMRLWLKKIPFFDHPDVKLLTTVKK